MLGVQRSADYRSTPSREAFIAKANTSTRRAGVMSMQNPGRHRDDTHNAHSEHYGLAERRRVLCEGTAHTCLERVVGIVQPAPHDTLVTCLLPPAKGWLRAA